MIAWTRDVGAIVYKDVVNGTIPLNNKGNATTELDYNGIRFEVKVNTDSSGKIVIGSVYPK